eukprot:765329-Hanusia_phi.AAC.2
MEGRCRRKEVVAVDLLGSCLSSCWAPAGPAALSTVRGEKKGWGLERRGRQEGRESWGLGGSKGARRWISKRVEGQEGCVRPQVPGCEP